MTIKELREQLAFIDTDPKFAMYNDFVLTLGNIREHETEIKYISFGLGGEDGKNHLNLSTYLRPV